MSRVAFGFGLVIAVSGASLTMGSSRARADTVHDCFDAAVAGQRLQRTGHFLDARERFASCAQAVCPREVVEDCSKWLSAVGDAIPSVVVAARDDQGHDVADALVTIDGRAVAATGAVPLDPGSHSIVVEHAGAGRVSQSVVLREGEKYREVLATFVLPSIAPTPRPSSPANSVERRRTPVGAYAAGGIAILGMAGFVVLGPVVGSSDYNSAHCSTGCAPSDASRVRTELATADASLAVAIVSAGLATWLWFSSPHVAP
jgi:hypothetical protein